MRDDGDALRRMSRRDFGQNRERTLTQLPVAFTAGPGEIVVDLRVVARDERGLIARELGERHTFHFTTVDFAQRIEAVRLQTPEFAERGSDSEGTPQRARVESGRTFAHECAVTQRNKLSLALRAQRQVEPSTQPARSFSGIDVCVANEQESARWMIHRKAEMCGALLVAT